MSLCHLLKKPSERVKEGQITSELALFLLLQRNPLFVQRFFLSFLIFRSKTNTKNIIGTAGIKRILEAIATFDVRTVCIGGINVSNIQRVLYQSRCVRKSLDGVAVVSAIIAAEHPENAARILADLIARPPPFATSVGFKQLDDHSVEAILKKVPSIIKEVKEKNPLSHNMTNLVVQNFAANIALAVGASPIMSNYGLEAVDLCKLGGALVINMGTVTPEGLQGYVQALKAYNLEGGPVVFDPVGAGATSVRQSAVEALMSAGYFDLIKGNEGEIKTVYGKGGVQQRGVDSGISTLDDAGKATLVQKLAARERNVVVMTGATDFISDGDSVFAISNGHEYLGKITGSGCVLGTILSATIAVHRDDKLVAAIAGLLYYEIAAEIAASRNDVFGPGTFVAALIDEIFRIGDNVMEEVEWLSKAKVEKVKMK